MVDFNKMLSDSVKNKAELKLPNLNIRPDGSRIDPIGDRINEAHRLKGLEEPPRGHLGASVIGGPCKRKTWLSFRWAVREEFEGRILRLFRRGKNEEETIIDDLRLAGFEVIGEYDDLTPVGLKSPSDGGQYRVELGSHVGGSTDGFLRGHPDAPTKWHVLEAKTHSKASFREVVAKGVKSAKYEHWVQMQIYMFGTGIDRALYYAVCKDNDEIYTERVKFDAESAALLISDAKALAMSPRMYEPISADPTYYLCKSFKCPAYNFCHKNEQTAPVNCRTCAFSVPTADSSWVCTKWDSEIPFEAQLRGCNEYIIHADLIPEQN